MRETYLFWHAVSLLNFVLIEEQHAHCGLPRGFWWFSGPGEGLRVVLRVCPGLGDLGFWAYVSANRCSTAGFGLGYEATEVFCPAWRRRRGDSAGKHEASTGQNGVASKSRQDQPSGRMLSKHRSAADAGNASKF